MPEAPSANVAAPGAGEPRALAEAAELFKVLGAEVRLAIVVELVQAPRSVQELVDTLGVRQPLMSQHLRVLRLARLVTAERRNRQRLYRLVDEHVRHIVADALQHVLDQPGNKRGSGRVHARGARAVIAGVCAMLTLTYRVIATRAVAIRAIAHSAGVRTIRAAADTALVVVHPLRGAVFAVNVVVMQVINMVTVQHRVVPTPWAVSMAVLLSLLVLNRGHDASLSGGPSHVYMRSYECQGVTSLVAVV